MFSASVAEGYSGHPGCLASSEEQSVIGLHNLFRCLAGHVCMDKDTDRASLRKPFALALAAWQYRIWLPGER